MDSSRLAANTFGTLGAVCWSVQLLPQIWQNYRKQDTTGLQPTMMLLWASAGIPLGIYNITRSFPIALQIQPQILTLLSLITWAQTQYYTPVRGTTQRGKMWCAVVLAVTCIVAGGVEAGIVFALRSAISKRTEAEIEYYWPVVLMGILSAALLAAGVGRHYIDIWKERTVRGISFVFVGIDALGDLTSMIGVVLWWRAGRRLDILGLVVYGSELLLWLGVFACGGWYNLRPWVKAKIGAHKSQSAEKHTVMEAEREPTQAGELVSHVADHAARTVCGDTTVGEYEVYASGTVFRTASDRSMPVGSETEVDSGVLCDRGALRMRNIVQV